MMMNRDRLGLWARIGAIVLAAVFILSFVLFGVGSNSGLNIFNIFGSNQRDQQAPQTSGSQEQIDRARTELKANPDDLGLVRRLAGLYLQNGQTDEAAKVLEEGRKTAPNDPTIPLILGQAYDQQAQALTDDGQRKAAYAKAADAYVAATKAEKDQKRNAQALILAGLSYEQAGDKARAIQYWNQYLEIEPKGKQADAVRQRIETLLKGGKTTGGAGRGTQGMIHSPMRGV